jgi:hypothetical protein
MQSVRIMQTAEVEVKKLLLTGIAALFLAIGAAHAREWQGNMPKPIGKLPSYPPVVCVTTNWTPEPCVRRKDLDLRPFYAFLAWLKWTETNWLGTALRVEHPIPWNGTWPRLTTVLYDESGGILQEHIKRFKALAASGNNVEVRSYCPSACTMIVAYVPSDRICFAEGTGLGFHMAQEMVGTDYATLKLSPKTAQWMVDQYPQAIREWIIDRGGVAKMTVGEPWTLDAPTLWQMGYRKCGPDPIELGNERRWKERDEKAEEMYKEWIKIRELYPLYPGTRPNL